MVCRCMVIIFSGIFDHEVPLVVQGITLEASHFSKRYGKWIKTDYGICFVAYGLQMYGLLLFDHEVPLVVQGIALIRASKISQK